METLKALIIKYKSLILYGIFGVCTTAINVIAYYILYNIAGIGNVISAIIAWVVAVAFAFVTNKLFVFESRSWKKSNAIHEIVTFISARLVTGIIDIIIMYFTVDILSMNSTLWKLISNIIVIILNYIASNTIVFKHKHKD